MNSTFYRRVDGGAVRGPDTRRRKGVVLSQEKSGVKRGKKKIFRGCPELYRRGGKSGKSPETLRGKKSVSCIY